MYVIFPLDELLDLNSARGNKRGRATLDKQSHTRHTEVEVLPLSQPNQQLPNQLKPPLSQPPKSRKQSTASIKPLKTPTPPQQKQQQPSQQPPSQQPPSQQQQQQQQQPPQSQKPTLSKTPSKLSLAVTPPSIVVSPQSPVSVPTSNQASNVKKAPPTQQQTVQPSPPQPQPPPSPQPSPQPPPAQVNKRQRSSHSTSTETSSTSSTGAKGKTLLSPQASGGAAAATAAAVPNRSSWGGNTAGPFQESCPARSGSFKACKDITVSGEGNSLKVVDQPSAAESALQEVRGSTVNVKPPVNNSNSFRSHLSDSCAQRPRHLGVEVLKKIQGSSSISSIPSQQHVSPSPPVESNRKPSQELSEQPFHSSSPSQTEPKGSEAVVTKQEIPLQTIKEKQTPGLEGVKIKQEVPVQASPPSSSSSQHQISAAESLRIQQECLSPPTQRHPSGRSNRSSGSQKLSDLPPSGSGGGSRGASGSANLKNQGVQGGPPRGLQQQQQQRNPTAMATNESSFRDLTNPNVNESLKAHNAFTFKLVKTGPSSGALEESQSPDETLDDQS